MHWIALPLPWRDEPATSPADPGVGVAADTMAAPAVGWWALRFTPRVALADGDTVLLEVSTTERLWGGRDALLALVLQAWAEAAGGQGALPQPPGMLPPWGSGPTALVAQAWLRMALAGQAPRWQEGQEGRPRQQGPAVHTLPLHTLTALRPRHWPSCANRSLPQASYSAPALKPSGS